MQRIIDIDKLDQALEIQKKYYRFCDSYDTNIHKCWYNEGESRKTLLQAFCEKINEDLDDD